MRELLDAAEIQLGEANDALARYRDALDLDPERLAEAEAQIAKLHELGRKHRVPVAQLKAHAQALRDELEGLRNAGVALQQARTRAQRDRTRVCGRGREADSALRAQTAQRLGARCQRADGRTRHGAAAASKRSSKPQRTKVRHRDAQGRERVEFLVSANPGQPPRALRKVASGGELSRISLAIEVAALGLDEIGTMVFDEVDAGIGGAVAEVVGQKLRRLGGQRQVLVRHASAAGRRAGPPALARGQVAATARARRRASTCSTTKSRRDEIARMLGGIEITRETLAHAKQMLESVVKS